jgi:anti-sigma regulatory factor (Ser/Thr protein kinase)
MTDGDGAVVRFFAASADAPSRVRKWLRPLIPAGSRAAALLAASEIVTNALMHGRLRAEEEIEVAVLAACDRARVRVSHPGETFAPAPVAAPGADGGWV